VLLKVHVHYKECFVLLDNLIAFFIEYGYFAVFAVLILCGLGLPIPEDITLVAGGIISSLSCPADMPILDALSKCHQVHVMFFVSMLGVLMGDSMMFFLGRTFGERILKTRFFARIIPPKRYQWIQEKFEKFGVLFIFAARFMPGLRSPLF
jgi:membrane protein DedA with SNARE-associated domain